MTHQPAKAFLYVPLLACLALQAGCAAGPPAGDLEHLDTLRFAIVGDTRPAVEDDTAGYPTGVIGGIWSQVQAQDPRPAFAIGTGDYVFASPDGGEAAAQLDLYLGARAAFVGPFFPALGNHECTGATASNCGAGAASGVTANFKAFEGRMLAPAGLAAPHYVVHAAATSGAWTAKLVFIAANAWSDDQAGWLEGALAEATTYTFVVRHEPASATTAPGVEPSEAILRAHPYTLLLAGHTHTFEPRLAEREVIVGNGGAPLTGAVGYGFVVARLRDDGAIAFDAHDAGSGELTSSFAVWADGSVAP